jgi:hypothetical protein
MLFCKNVHKGTFIKQIIPGNFSEEIQGDINSLNTNYKQGKPETQILVVTENSLELYDYYFEESIKIPFLEPRTNQDLYLHILDAKIINSKNNQNLVVLLTTCGIVVMKYSSKVNQFLPVCSEVLNLNCEERDKLMYLTVEEKYKKCDF